MNNKKITSLALSAILAISTVTPAFAAGNNSNIKKDETVYILMDDKGKVKEKTVSVWLHGDEKLDVEDISNLKDIKNLKGDEQPEKKGNKLHWKSDKKDIYYQGKSTKDLPIDLKITYKLDGKKTSLKKLEGKSGKLEIQIEAKNKEKFRRNINGKMETLHIPYIVAGGISLSTDTFKEIETNGKVLDDGKTEFVGFSLFPGMAETFQKKLDTLEVDIYDYIEDSITITADVKNFEKPTMLFTITDLFETDPEFEEFDSFDELTDALEELDEKGQEMLDGAIELQDGSMDFSDAIYDLVDAHKELYDGSNDLYDGANNLQSSMEDALDGTKLLSSGSQDLNDGAKKLNLKFSDLVSGVNTLDEKMEDLNDGARKLKEGTDDLVEGTATLNDGAQAMKAGFDEVASHIEEYEAKGTMAQKSVEELKKGAVGIDEKLEALRGNIEEKQKDIDSVNDGKADRSSNAKVASALAEMQGQVIRLNEKATELENIAKGLPKNASIADAPKSGNLPNKQTLAQANQALDDFRGDVSESIDESLKSQSYKIDNAMSLVGAVGRDSSDNLDTSGIERANEENKEKAIATAEGANDLKSRAVALRETADEIQLQINIIKSTMNLNLEEIKISVDDIIADNTKQIVGLGMMVEQMTEINAKIAMGKAKLPTLNDKILELTDGVEKLYDGSKDLQEGQGELYDGTLKLADGVSDLKDGSEKLYDGTTDLQEGTEAAVKGSADLDEGLNKLQLDGVSPLKDGVGKLSGGLSSLYNKSPDLTEAADDLVEGTTELADGVNEYMEDGIKEMRRKVTEKTDDIEDIMAMRDELVEISQNKDSFTGKPEAVETKVKYVIKVQ